MSRSKNLYQGISLGRVQRSEYDDAKLRDLARQDARLGESLKTVDRAKNVMKKSLEADKHMLVKAGLQMTRKLPVTSQGAHSYLESKTPSQQSKVSSDPRVKRFSVTDMPSDLDRTRQYRKKSVSRPPSYHEQFTNVPISKEHSYSHDKLLESRVGGTQASGKNHLPNHADAIAAFGASERLRGSDQTINSELDQYGANSTTRSTTYMAQASKYGKPLPKTDANKAGDSTGRQTEACVTFASDSNNGKSDEHSIEHEEDSKDKGGEQAEGKDQDVKLRKRTTIWETLSTPKYTSMAKSKRNQIELEFTAARLKSYKSSPALFSTAKVKALTLPGQGKPPLAENGSHQGRKVEELKVKPTAASRTRID